MSDERPATGNSPGAAGWAARIRAGMPAMGGRGFGDMVIEVVVETPTRLSARQKELLEAFRDTETGDECPDSKGFFKKLKSAWEGLTD